MPAKHLLTQMIQDSAEFARLYQESQEAKTIDGTLRIAVCGLMNAGKSALLNALTGHLETEFFRTQAIRSTVAVQALIHCGVTYVDTPGIDANDEDDQLAWCGLASADIILFAHNLQSGTLETVEVEFLKELKRRRPDVESCLLVVLTHAESASEQLQDRLEAISAILASLFKAPRTMVPTSFTTYRKGVLERKPALLERSGINVLHGHLKTLIERIDGDLQSMRRIRNDQRQGKLEAIFDKAIVSREHALAEAESLQSQAFQALRQSVSQLATTTREHIARSISTESR
jgi:tRNA U34 5-carboxymethylaminomethyl modifying GTPase MnmE/TrmE